jgi:hypothetical protein
MSDGRPDIPVSVEAALRTLCYGCMRTKMQPYHGYHLLVRRSAHAGVCIHEILDPGVLCLYEVLDSEEFVRNNYLTTAQLLLDSAAAGHSADIEVRYYNSHTLASDPGLSVRLARQARKRCWFRILELMRTRALRHIQKHWCADWFARAPEDMRNVG